MASELNMIVPPIGVETSDESLGFNDKAIRFGCHRRATLCPTGGRTSPLWILTIASLFARKVAWPNDGPGGKYDMESNQRFYMRRAAEERTAAIRAITPQAREWHHKLAQDFARRAAENGAVAMTA
jgi:hypothetical protein